MHASTTHRTGWKASAIARSIAVASSLIAVCAVGVAGHAAPQAASSRGRLDPHIFFERLPQSFGTTHAIFQDRRGFMWFATDSGLFRFDGYQFRPQRAARRPGGELMPIRASAIGEDAQGGLWLATEDGLCRLDVLRATVRTVTHDPQDPASITPHALEALYVDPEGIVWLGSLGLERLDPATGRVTHFLTASGAGRRGPTTVLAISPAADGRLWLGTNNGVEAFDRRTGQSTHYGDAAMPGLVQAIAAASDGAVWLATATGTYRLDPRTGLIEPIRGADGRLVPELRTWAATLIPVGDRMWVGTNAGLVIVDPLRPDDCQRFERLPSLPEPVGAAGVRAMFIDRDGALWLAPQGQAICRYDPATSVIARYRNDPTDPTSLWTGSVWAVAEAADGGLWVAGNGGGLTRVDPATGTVQRLEPLPGSPLGGPGGDVRGLAVDRAGAVWVATYDAGVVRVDVRARTVRRFRHDATASSGLEGDRVRCVHVDREGTVWVGSYLDGLLRWQPSRDRFERVAATGRDADRFVVMAIAEGPDGAIWAGTRDRGLVRVARDGGVTWYAGNSRDPRSISSNLIEALHVDARGRVWLGGTLGLEMLDPASGEVRRFRDAQGLSSEAIRGITDTPDGSIWIATDNGLSRLDATLSTFRTFSGEEGVARSCNHGTLRRTRSGLLCVGGPDGLIVFDPARLPANPKPPPVVLTDFRLGSGLAALGRPGSPLMGDVDAARGVTLSPDEYSFTIEFAALNYRAASKNRYLYKLEGLDRDWIQARPGERQASYTGLPPGEYYFRVKGANNDGVWNPTPRSLRIVLEPPWWRTRWAHAGAVVAFVLVVISFVQMRTRVQRREIARQRTINDELARLSRARELALSDAEASQAALQELNEALEERVRERTVQLETANQGLQAANRELESFTYSVSHDLRAPLRAIDGFSKILLNDHRASLSSEGARLLGIVCERTVQMGRLIDDLLTLSRLGRGPLNRRTVDMTEVVRSVIADLGAECAGRPFEFVVSGMPAGEADPGLIKQVWFNLVANAVKFTRGRDPARVEIGWEQVDGVGAYFVKDNGAGFEMEYAGKLFGVFQRLHSSQEYEGTGVGLAIVQRIVQRHGGRIWATGAPGEGASFWFTLAS